MIAAEVSEQSDCVENQVGWAAGGGGFLRGGRNSQQPLAQAPLDPRSCLQVSGRASRAGNLMQMSAASFSGMKIGPKDATFIFFTDRSLHVFDLSLNAPVKVVSRNQRGHLGTLGQEGTKGLKT